MTKTLIATISIFLAMTCFAAAGEISVLHRGVNPNAITVNVDYSISLGKETSYSNRNYIMDLADMNSKVLEAKRQGQVVDILIDKSAQRFTLDVITMQVRAATKEERENLVTTTQDQNLALQAEIIQLREKLRSLGQ